MCLTHVYVRRATFGDMAGNRVEKLESRVNELEASVSGLTEELMQTKSRLRDLEEESSDEYIEAGVGSTGSSELATSTGSPSSAEGDKPTEHEESDDAKPPEADDIIVA